jgi:hypothetical protein
MFETLHASALRKETCCSLAVTPILRVTGVLAEDLWDEGKDVPVPDACRRCAAAIRQLLREFDRDCQMRHPGNADHWLNCWCGRHLDVGT